VPAIRANWLDQAPLLSAQKKLCNATCALYGVAPAGVNVFLCTATKILPDIYAGKVNRPEGRPARGGLPPGNGITPEERMVENSAPAV
jgi:hypothetical protein